MTWATMRKFDGMVPFHVVTTLQRYVADRIGWRPDVWDRRPRSRAVSRAAKLVAVGCRWHGLTLDEVARFVGCTRQAVHYQCRTFDPSEAEARILEDIKAL